MALEEKRRQGAVGHVGVYFSGGFKALKAFLDKYRESVEFCSIQLNYMDWSLAARAGKGRNTQGTSAFPS